MSTDRELLELAAKASGIEVRFVSTVSADYRFNLGELPYTHKPHQRADELKRFSDWSVQWNPLTDDGDALRLAVKLCLNLELSDAGSVVAVGIDDEVVDFGTGDPYAATRRAIVRAAAEIGRDMP